MGQEPQDRLDEDLEIDSETAENVTGGFFKAAVIRTEDSHKNPEHHLNPEFEIRQ
jgi:hypothetical protein